MAEQPSIVRGTRVLVISGEQVGTAMAGPAIRARELAQQLAARGASVQLGTPRETDDETTLALAAAGVSPIPFGMPTARAFRRLARGVDVVVTQPQRVDVAWGLYRAGRPVIYDLYVPSFVERIAALAEQADLSSAQRRTLLSRDQMEYAAAIELGTAFVCATERQRDHWLGALGQAGRLDADLLRRDPSGDETVAVVPFGVPEAPPEALTPDGANQGAIRGRLVPDDSIVLLWTGGLWNWFDPVTLLDGLARARKTEPRLRLVVLGGRHPEARWVEHDAARHARERAAELGLTNPDDPGVVFVEDWVEYGERHRYLLDADAGVCAHHESLETRLSFRTRFLDHLWAGLPTLSTEGGALTDDLAEAGAAWTVPAASADAWCTVLERFAADGVARESMAERARALRDEYTWPRCAAPLADTIARVTATGTGTLSHSGTQPAVGHASGASVPPPTAPAPILPPRARRANALRYSVVLVRGRVQGKGIRSLVSAIRDALRRAPRRR